MKQTVLALLFVSMVILATVDFASSVPLHGQLQGGAANPRPQRADPPEEGLNPRLQEAIAPLGEAPMDGMPH